MRYGKKEESVGLRIYFYVFWGIIVAAFITAIVQQDRTRHDAVAVPVDARRARREVVMTPEEQEKFEAYMEQEHERAEDEAAMESQARMEDSRFGGGY
ncbi:hypothetical protein LLH00_17905 [bacterium]|nr:hypothetical protein [bacterium]